ncbi:hypothetical protein P153DRAFT_365006 [Dothidotthia symphoricarpi CBS 119687]|uniref:Tachykinin family protein n=1 Tax=Dothidotthia symphoricarpi CBS 119687 TaxID=1392245 RepID=A0A6A6AJY0_9PLEO|nr:uncharacterized protein P153DRAFT_365006 [Dothidotthia symphoricarpi CBS 119687]KAF2131418.1 hypothetical protein P153DRAFT_365006 [Dothidotthia symphoricarpi CBS 119687]
MPQKQKPDPHCAPSSSTTLESPHPPSSTTSRNVNSKRTSQKDKSRKYFQQAQPTFSLELPTHTPKLEFLDNFDPDKDLVVRKKAREWVNKNKGLRTQPWRARPEPKKIKTKDGNEQQKQLAKRKNNETTRVHDPLKIIGVSQKDPFNMLPDIGRNYDHIIDFFLSGCCPEEIPCSDDKYVQGPEKALVSFSQENSIFWNVSKSDLSFTLWLFATVSVRGGLSGNPHTEEIQWFYLKALRLLQETLQKETELNEFSDEMLTGLACVMATANYSGMFSTAALHRDAMLRMLTLRGGGDIIKGFLSVNPWGKKCMQWCEFMIAAQLVEVPKVPYEAPIASAILPPTLAREACRLTAVSLSNLPPLCEPLQIILGLLHQLALSYAHRQPRVSIDSYVITPLYNVEFTLLETLAAQRLPDHGYSDVEVLLTETFQLFFWTGPRQLPTQIRMCDLFVSRIMKALLPLLLETELAEDMNGFRERASSLREDNSIKPPNVDDYLNLFHRNSRHTNNAIMWSLALGTIVSATFQRPEHLWFKGRLDLQLRAMGLYKKKEEYQTFLNMFPSTDGFAWIDLRNIPD